MTAANRSIRSILKGFFMDSLGFFDLFDVDPFDSVCLQLGTIFSRMSLLDR